MPILNLDDDLMDRACRARGQGFTWDELIVTFEGTIDWMKQQAEIDAEEDAILEARRLALAAETRQVTEQRKKRHAL